MKTNAFKLAAGAMTAVSLWLVTGPGGAQGDKAAFKAFLPATAYKELVMRAAKSIEADLATADEDSLKRAQVNAVLIAGYALSAQDATGAAGVEATAVDLAGIVTNKAKLDQAKKLAASLAALKGQPGGKASVEALAKLPEDIGDLMNLMKTKGKGGEGIPPALQSNIRLKGTQNGIEEKVRELAKKKLAPARVGLEADELALLGYRLAVMAELTDLHPAPRKGGATPKDWHDLSAQMRDTGVELALAAGKKDAEAIFKVSGKLNSSCTQCHSLFR
jgi:hypothetical protein